MLVQLSVETVAGTHLRLDDVLGPWFAVIGFECDPLAKAVGYTLRRHVVVAER